MNRGVVFAVSAYIFWGLHPIYWKLLKHVPSVEIVSHRIVWSLVFFLVILSSRKEWRRLWMKIRESPRKLILFAPAFLIGSNWGVYIWAVNAGYIIETSLGYFICPLISVFLGVVFIRERLRMFQWAAVLVACAGVLTMTVIYGKFPWISLYLAVTWGGYGLLRKKSPLSSVEGLTLETIVLSIPAMGYLGYVSTGGGGLFLSDPATTVLLIGTGIISGLPLLIFIMGARMIQLSLIGILQYIYPTLILGIGVFIYHEQLSAAKVIGLIFVWLALAVYTIEGILFYNTRNRHRKN